MWQVLLSAERLIYDKMTAGLCHYSHPAVNSAAPDEQIPPTGKFTSGAFHTSRPLTDAKKLQCGATTTTPAPSMTTIPLAKASPDTKHLVEMAVAMPDTVEQFNTYTVKTSFK